MTRDTMERKTIRITAGQLDEVQQAVARGEYPNDSEAIRAAIREKFQEDDPEPAQILVESGNGKSGRVGVDR